MSKRYICTWAQNNTHVHGPFWCNLMAYAKHRKATVLVQPGKYRSGYDPLTHSLDIEESVWWDEAVLPYLVEQDTRLGPHIAFYADCEIRATRKKPLGGKEFWGASTSGIFGHPKWQLACHAVPGARYPKIQQTTGACTIENYSDSDAGKQAHMHHFFGAAIVEVDAQGHHHIRKINAVSSDGSFFDTSAGAVYEVTAGKVQQYKGGVPALMIGDSHAEESCAKAVGATLEMIKLLQPERRLGNDVMSASAQNKHNTKQTFGNWARHQAGHDDVLKGLRQAQEMVLQLGLTDMLDSNHHDHLDQWCDDVRGHSDVINSEVWHELNLLRRRTGDCAMKAWLESRGVVQEMNWTSSSNPLTILGTFFCHGHEGPNGARGMVSQGYRLGRKIVQGHTHTPSGLGGHNAVGHTSLPQHGYNNASLSSWLQGNGVLYPNGKFQHLHIIRDSKGLWRL